jgi:hypothetical protein
MAPRIRCIGVRIEFFLVIDPVMTLKALPGRGIQPSSQDSCIEVSSELHIILLNGRIHGLQVGGHPSFVGDSAGDSGGDSPAH